MIDFLLADQVVWPRQAAQRRSLALSRLGLCLRLQQCHQRQCGWSAPSHWVDIGWRRALKPSISKDSGEWREHSTRFANWPWRYILDGA